ncbi:hypothetical protein JTB14_021962 [Gonioctena quinquepunctata]|nr:hypothetical protein JTB14_021962 [Gonioctena quinquepunctata]
MPTHRYGALKTRDSRGRRIEILLEQDNICLANSGEATHFNARSNYFSSMDLTLCTPQIIPALTWKPLEDLHSSDHFPIQNNFDTPERNMTPGKKWVIKKANWDVFSNLVSLPNPDLFEEINDAVDAATNAILLAAHSAIPKAMSKGSSESVPWWNESIKLAITSRNEALRVFQRNPENGEPHRIQKTEIMCSQNNQRKPKKVMGRIRFLSDCRYTSIRALEDQNYFWEKLVHQPPNLSSQ